MSVYARIWKIAAGLLGAVGVALALLTEPPHVVLGALAAAAAIALSLGLGMSVGTGNQAAPMKFLPVFAVSFCVVAALALLIVGVYTVFAIAALIAGTSPFVLQRVLGFGHPAAHETSIFGNRPDSGITTMSTAELAAEWRRTYVALRDTRSAAATIAVVRERAALLDELERRDSEGIHVWLESECRAAGDPTKYMQHRNGGSAAA